MSLHEYIDIPLEGSVSARAASPPPATSPHHPPLVAARLCLKSGLEASALSALSDEHRGEDLASRENGREGGGRGKGKRRKAGEWRVVWHRADGTTMLDSGMRPPPPGWSSASRAGIGRGLTAST